MIHPELDTTRHSGYIICTPDPPIIYHCLLKLQLSIWLHIRLFFMTTDGRIKLELGSHMVSSLCGSKWKNTRLQLHNRMILKNRSEGESSQWARAIGSMPGHIFCVEKEVSGDKWLSQLIKWLKVEKNEGWGTRRSEGKACKFTYGKEHKI